MSTGKLVRVGEKWVLELPEHAAWALGAEDGAEVTVELTETGLSARAPELGRARTLAAGAQSMVENRQVLKKLSSR